MPAFFTQYQAFRHPRDTPAIKSMSVQENLLGQVVSIQMPRATPIRVGIVTD